MNILKGKRNGVLTVQPTQTIAALAERLRSAGVGVMIVSSDGKSLEGNLGAGRGLCGCGAWRSIAYVEGLGLNDTGCDHLLTPGTLSQKSRKS